MALTYDALVAILTPKAGTLRAPGSQFLTPSVEALFESFLVDATLSLTAATATANEQERRVTVTGALRPKTLLGLERARISSGVWTLQADGSVTVVLEVEVNDPRWALADSFDVLQGSIFDQVRFADAVFTLDSTAADVLPAGFRASFGYETDVPAVAQRLVKGLSLAAGLSFTGGVASDLAHFFKPPMAVRGPIELYFVEDETSGVRRPFPQFLLETTTQSGLTIRIGDSTFTFAFQAASIFQELTFPLLKAISIIPTGVLAVRTHFAPSDATGLPISVLLYESSAGTLIFNTVSPPMRSVRKDALAGLLNGADPGGLLDPGHGFPLFDGVTLRSLSVWIGVPAISVELITIGIAIGAGKNWELFDGLVTIKEIGFTVEAVFGGGGANVSGAIHASAYLAGNEHITLSAYVALPRLFFECTLEETVPIDLTAAVKALIGESIALPAITGTTFTVSGNVSAGTYTLEGTIKEQWPILGDAVRGLVLGNIYLKLTYRKGIADSGSSVSGAVFGDVMLAGARVALMAAYQTSGGWTFSGSTAPGQAIKLTALLEQLAEIAGVTIPPGLPEIDVDQIDVSYSTSGHELDVTATVKTPGASFDLTRLPLVGSHLDHSATLRLETVRFSLGKTDEGTTSELTFLVRLGTADSVELTIPISGKPAGSSELAAAAGVPITYPTQGSGLWIPVQRRFGPIEIEKVGFTLDAHGLGVQLNAGMALAVLSIEILGLEMVIPLTDPYEPRFDIHGLAASYNGGALTIEGALVRIDGPHLQFDGFLIVQAPSLGLTAFGSFATTDPPSFFAFVLLDAPIGGQPFFYVTGLAGGLGVNRSLKLPALDNILSFPLVAGATAGPSNPFGAAPTYQKFLDVMESSMEVDIGEYWLAAGIAFTTFDIVTAYALVTVAFGNRLQIGVLGLATYVLPPDDPAPVVAAQLALEAEFTPDIGELFVSAQLTPNSYVLAKACQLTGGFAFYLWFPPSPHAGEFVVTLGGYNPYFTAPGYYPSVPRLGFIWTVKDTPLVIKGGMYAALTPHAVMAGGYLNATWESGPISAWFDLNADFLIQWQPFHYEIYAGVNFGVRARVHLLFVTVTISVSVGADLHIWGPEFTGVAHIHLSVLSFSISFGAGSPNHPQPLGWAKFKDSFLPVSSPSAVLAGAGPTATDALLKTVVSDGLLKDVRGTSAPVDFVVDPQRFVLDIRSSIPAKSGTFNGRAIDGAWNGAFGIGPMGLDNDAFHSDYTITVEHEAQGLYPRLAVAPVAGRVPKALWNRDDDLKSSLNHDALLTDVVQALTIAPIVDTPDHSLPISVAALIYEDELDRTWAWGADIAPATDPYSGDDPWTVLTTTIADATVAAARHAAVVDLMRNGFAVKAQIGTEPLTHRDGLNLLDPVVLNELGENTAKGHALP